VVTNRIPGSHLFTQEALYHLGMDHDHLGAVGSGKK